MNSCSSPRSSSSVASTASGPRWRRTASPPPPEAESRRADTMTTIQALTDQEVDKLARDWYHALDVHVPVEELLPMLAAEGVTMVFPEATLHGIDEFKGWYRDVTHKFFDEIHTVKEVDSKPRGGESDVKVV